MQEALLALKAFLRFLNFISPLLGILLWKTSEFGDMFFYVYICDKGKVIVCLPSFHKYKTQKIVKKFVLSLGLLCAATVSAFAGHHVWIHTSCGVSIDMVYEDHHTGADVLNDALLLEAYFCGD